MSRTTRTLLCVLCLLAFGLAAAPVFAQPNPLPADAFTMPIRLIQTVTVVGAGETVAEAEANALAELHAKYLVLSYTVVSSFCAEVQIDPFDPNSTFTLCSAKIEAKVIRKAWFP